MKDENLERAKKALKDWSDKVTVEDFIKGHERLGLVKPVGRPPSMKLLYALFSILWTMPILILTGKYLFDQQGFSEYRVIATLFVILCLWYVEKLVYLARWLFGKNKY